MKRTLAYRAIALSVLAGSTGAMASPSAISPLEAEARAPVAAQSAPELVARKGSDDARKEGRSRDDRGGGSERGRKDRSSGSGRDKARVPGGSGCDDAGDIREHAGCRR